MWSSWIGKKCNSCHVYCNGKVWFQRVMKLSKQFGKGFEIGVMEERENGLTHKKWSLNVFLLYKN
jgi:hypothetical protein